MHKLPTGRELVKVLDFRKLPKVLLHEHLDGGVRPATVIDLAKSCGYKGLPTSDAGELADWFHRGAQRGTAGHSGAQRGTAGKFAGIFGGVCAYNRSNAGARGLGADRL